jgi:hypothetical protein
MEYGGAQAFLDLSSSLDPACQTQIAASAKGTARLRSHQTGKGGWASGPKAQGTKRNTSHFLAHVYPCLSKYFQVFSV